MIVLPDIPGAVGDPRYIGKLGEPCIPEETAWCSEVEGAALFLWEMCPRVLKLGFSGKNFELDEIILPAVISERYVIGNLCLQPARGGASKNGPKGKVEQGSCLSCGDPCFR
jgi:hypothetical protein